MQVGLVEARRIDEAWPYVREWIEDAFSYSVHHEMTLDELYIDIRQGRSLLLVIGTPGGHPQRQSKLYGTAVLNFSRMPDRPAQVQMVACGGIEVESWLGALFQTVEKIAQDAGAGRIVALGRPGWVRLMRPYGVKQNAAVFSVDVRPRVDLGSMECKGSA